jgi:uncharacterized protein YqgC (DUF456 family)
MLVSGVAVVMVLGLIGTVVPGVPGLLVIFGAAMGYGYLEGFAGFGMGATAVLVLLLIAGSLASYVLPHRAGVAAGVGRRSLRLGIVGALVGFFVIPVIGFPIGGVLGVWVGEQERLGDWARAWATTRRVLIGFGLGALAEIAAGVLMIATWAAWAAWVLLER